MGASRSRARNRRRGRRVPGTWQPPQLEWGGRATGGKVGDPAPVRGPDRLRHELELGFGVTEKPVHIHDLQATILHLLGMDHTRLTYRFQGRDYRLTDVHGNVVKELLA